MKIQTKTKTGTTSRGRGPIPPAAKIISARQVRDLFGGASEMFLWRLLNERPKLKFPRPFQINKRNFFNRAQVDAWIAAQEAGAKKVA